MVSLSGEQKRREIKGRISGISAYVSGKSVLYPKYSFISIHLKKNIFRALVAIIDGALFVANSVVWFFLGIFKKIQKLIGRPLMKTLVTIYRIWRWIKKRIIIGVHEAEAGVRRKFLTLPTFIILITVLTVVTNIQGKAQAHENDNSRLLDKLFSNTEDLTVVEARPTITAPKTNTKQMAALESPIPSLENKPSKPSTEQQKPSSLTLTETTGALATRQLTGAPIVQRSSIVTYTVKPGDTISTIAEKYGINTNTVMWANKLSKYSIIKPGENLKILPKNGVLHTVKSAETLSQIANTYKVKVSDIVKANNMVSANQLKVGQQLIIEGGTPPKPKPSTRLASINKIFTATPVKASGDKTWIWPLPASRRITQYYHYGHRAIDVAGRPWNDLVASRGGRVEHSGWSNGYGYNVVINHGNNIKTRYAHMSKLFVKVGDQIKQGEAIGKVGSTGRSTGPHVHFEIMINGKKVNPLSYVE